MPSTSTSKISIAPAAAPTGVSPELQTTLTEIVKSAMGVEPKGFLPIIGLGECNRVTIVSTDKGSLVVRLNSAEHLHRFKKEAWCIERAHEAGVLVPRVLSCGVQGSTSYSIAGFIEDSSVIDGRFDRLCVWNALGREAAKINSAPIVGFGSKLLPSGNFELTGKQSQEAELANIFRDNYWEESKALSPRQHGRIKEELAHCLAIQAPPGICHWDIGPANARIRHGDYNQLFLLDFEWAVAAPVPHYQLACVAKPQGLASQEFTAFKAGYGISDAQWSAIALDVQRLVVISRMSSVRWAQDRRPAHLQGVTTAAVTAILELLQEK